MKVGIEETLKFDDVVKISAGNYKGELGQHKIYLREL
jgi:formylmethanofuran--tetrahydromethanopterin N-formyltransferase